MRLYGSSSPLRERFHSFSNTLSEWFPVPKLLTPPAAGIDISDASIKWLVFEHSHPRRVQAYGELPLKEGVVQSGVIQDIAALADALREVKEHLGGITAAHAALPEEGAYVFSMSVPPGTPHDQMLRIIEFEFEGRVPIPPSAAVYDYASIPSRVSAESEIAVSVFPKDIAQAYADAFDAAGIALLSLEVEAQSIARAITSEGDDAITLVVDFGRARTGFAVIKRGTPIFTSTVEVGGETITRSLMEKLGVSAEEAGKFKNEQGLLAKDGAKSKGVEAISGTASALADEISRHYHYWDTRRNEHGDRMTPVSRVLLVGGNANLKGLTDYIAGRVQAPTERGDVWKRIADFDSYIPPIDRKRSYQYATAIGLALRGI